MRSGFCVMRRVRFPRRASASDASMPACPPPTTIASKSGMSLPHAEAREYLVEEVGAGSLAQDESERIRAIAEFGR